MKVILFLLLTAGILFSQQVDLYKSNPVREAYKNKTRSINGEPGENYWQNKSDYKIKVNVNPETKKLTGNLEVKYYNESPDTLNRVVMRLYQDFYRKGNARDFQISPQSINDGVEIDRIKVRDKELDVAAGGSDIVRYGTNMTINLEKPIDPGSNIKIEVDWSFYLPTTSTVRMGAYADTSMFVGYWYPQIAVYDDIDGWDELNYTGLTEMYNDFSNYNVEITAPKNYIVWATGVLKNPEEILREPFLKRYNRANNSDSTINIISLGDSEKSITIGDSSIWKYEAKKIPDFAFALGKNYLWDASTVHFSDGEKVLVDAGYRKDSKYFRDVERILREGVLFHSETMPGIEFPFPAVSAFNGGGGMEFPMLLNDGEASSYPRTVGLTLHELSHTYFPFYMGINERRYAFLDEGWAVFLPEELQRSLGDVDPMARRYKRYYQQATNATAIPPMVPSFDMDRTSYRMTSYTRSGAAYFSLQALLGNEVFGEALREFINRWSGKHPTAYDMFYTFNKVAEQNINWFWQKWFFEFGVAEMEIDNFKTVDDKKQIDVINRGGLPMPIILNVYYNDNTKETIIKNPDVWKSGATKLIVNLEAEKKITMITLGNDYFPNISDKTKLNINE